MSDAQGQAQAGSATGWITTSRADRGSERGLLHELRITAYLVVGLIAILALAIVLG